MHQLTDKKNKIIIYLILLLILSTTNVKFEGKKKNYPSSVNSINVKGLSNNKNMQILSELNNFLFQNILIIRKEEVKKIIEQHSIVEQYTIKKIYPSKININIKPTKLIARVSDDNQLLIGANGKLIKNRNNNEKLPYLFGEFNSAEFLLLKKNIEESKFNFNNFKTLYFFPSNRWDLLTSHNILIKLPLENLLQSLNLAHKVINNDYLKNKNIIDLRVSNHLIVK